MPLGGYRNGREITGENLRFLTSKNPILTTQIEGGGTVLILWASKNLHKHSEARRYYYW